MHYDLVFALLSLGLIIVLGFIYSVHLLSKGPVRFARVEQQGGSVLLTKGAMEMGYWFLQPLGRFCLFLRLSPNQISWCSLGFALISGGCLAFGQFGFGAGCCAISGFLDCLDGMVARITGVASDAGEVLDASIDRYAEFFFLAGLVFYYRFLPFFLGLTLLALMGSFMVSYSTAKAEALEVHLPTSTMRRPERTFYLFLGALLSPLSMVWLEVPQGKSLAIAYPMVLALGLVAILSNLSAVQRLKLIAKLVRKRQEVLQFSQKIQESSSTETCFH